jgi:hypothetical protein|tara:strand:- start:224 stop:517 length:294 start_codon:yes stop_codon:yes gene_type:complete
MLTVNNNTKINFLLEALPLNDATMLGDIIVEAIEEISYPVTEETIGDLTIKEFENLLIDLTDDWVMNTDYVDDNEVRLERFDEILERATFRETIVID